MAKITRLLSLAEPTSGIFPTRTAAREWSLAAVATAAVTAASLALVSIAGYVAVALLYLLLVVIIGVNFSRSTVLFTAASSALLWNFLFIPPRFTFYITRLEDLMLFAMFFIVALAMGQITSRLRAIQLVQQQRERRTEALYELVQQAGLAHELDTGLRAALRLIDQIFNVRAALLLRCRDHSLARDAHGASNFSVDDNAYYVAQSAFARGIATGRGTETMADAEVIGLPLKGRTAVMGVLLVAPQRQRIFDPAERELIETFAVLIGTILEREHLLAAVKHAEILEASEQLRRALLHSVSHELKTPLAAVQTGIEALAVRTAQDGRAGATIVEVQSALRRLHRVINNLLSMSRIESGVVQTQLDWCDIGELIEAARDLAGDNLNDHKIAIECDSNAPMVRVDQALLEQSLCNLLLNSASWSRTSTTITIAASVQADELILSVLDEGEGIPPEDLPRIFDAFHRAARAKPGGTGLGLAIVDGFVRAHGGKVAAANRYPSGAKFTITIPAQTLPAHLMERLH
jgi:two-component system, OmpR family, sensor histidine kinase KdpD